MCLLSSKLMEVPHSITRNLQAIMHRYGAFCNELNLKELSQAEFEHYTQVRKMCVRFIKDPHEYFGTQADTFATAVSILDVFLWKVKVTERHMSIVAGACFFVAAKMLETEERCPSARELAELRNWTERDLCRMELRLLATLSWHVPSVTYLSLLPVLADAYGLSRDLVQSQDVLYLAGRFLERCSTVLMPPAALALALVQTLKGEMEKNPLEMQICVHCNIEDTQLSQCKKTLAHLSSIDMNPSPPPSPPRLCPKFPMKIFDKPSEAGVTPLYTIVEEPMSAQA